jgi:hypothetical protein
VAGAGGGDRWVRERVWGSVGGAEGRCDVDGWVMGGGNLGRLGDGGGSVGRRVKASHNGTLILSSTTLLHKKAHNKISCYRAL